jgi:hypothetical protein
MRAKLIECLTKHGFKVTGAFKNAYILHFVMEIMINASDVSKITLLVWVSVCCKPPHTKNWPTTWKEISETHAAKGLLQTLVVLNLLKPSGNFTYDQV